MTKKVSKSNFKKLRQVLGGLNNGYEAYIVSDDEISVYNVEKNLFVSLPSDITPELLESLVTGLNLAWAAGKAVGKQEVQYAIREALGIESD